MTALWIGSRNTGDILGTSFGEVMMTWFGMRWDAVMVVYALFCVGIIVLIYRYLKTNPGKGDNDGDDGNTDNLELVVVDAPADDNN